MGRKISVIAAVFFLSAVVFTFTACNFAGDSARVTINIGKPPELASRLPQKPGILDRIVSFFTLGTTAHADPSPEDWYEIRLNVTGEGMSPLEVEIPLDTGRITLTLPLGKKTFTVVVEGDGVRLYGAIKAVTVSGADTINMQLGYLPNPSGALGWVSIDRNEYGEGYYNALDWWTEFGNEVDGYYILRAKGVLRDFGPGDEPVSSSFSRISTISNYEITDYSDYVIDYLYVYWYKIVPFNEFGEGDTTEAYPDYPIALP